MAIFAVSADRLVQSLTGDNDKIIDLFGDVTLKCVFAAFSDALGLPPGATPTCSAFPIWYDSDGDRNALFRAAMVEDVGPSSRD